jgi:hypothetical protein
MPTATVSPAATTTPSKTIHAQSSAKTPNAKSLDQTEPASDATIQQPTTWTTTTSAHPTGPTARRSTSRRETALSAMMDSRFGVELVWIIS